MNRIDPETFADMLLDGINAYINRLEHPISIEEHPVPIIPVEEPPYEYDIDPNPDPEDMPF